MSFDNFKINERDCQATVVTEMLYWLPANKELHIHDPVIAKLTSGIIIRCPESEGKELKVFNIKHKYFNSFN